MKKTLAILLILAMALSLCACGKTAITGVEFCSRMETLGLEAYPSSDLVDGETITKAYIGGNDDLTVIFWEIVSEEKAKNGFLNSQAEAPSGMGSTSEVNAPHSGFYSKKTSDECFMSAYVGSTMIMGWGSAEQFDTLKNIFKTMGYK